MVAQDMRLQVLDLCDSKAGSDIWKSGAINITLGVSFGIPLDKTNGTLGILTGDSGGGRFTGIYPRKGKTFDKEGKYFGHLT